MSFFEPLPPVEEEPAYQVPPWMEAPEDVLGVAVGSPFVLARTEALALAVLGLTAFPLGLTFSLAMVVRRGHEAEVDLDFDFDIGFYRFNRQRRRDPDKPLPDELLRFGVEYDDGRKATNLGHHHWDLEAGEEPPGPVLSQRGGGGGSRSYRQGWWLWPLPEGDRLTFVAEWPAKGIPLTKHDVEAEPIRRAAREARPIWD